MVFYLKIHKLTDMRKLLILMMMPMLLAVSCSKFDDTTIWDKLNDHETRIVALETLCRKMNTNIEAIQAIVEVLQKNEYVTSVVPITEGGNEVGYTISFSSGKNITLYHGKDAYIPVFGVKQDADGVYCWTIDGEWLVDDAGNKIPTTGEDGITPQLKIEEGKWFVSYDNGVTWVMTGQATGDAFFQSVTETNDYVLMVLANGTEIQIPKVSAVAATLTLDNVSGFTATFKGQVIRHSLDLKVTVYYSTTDNLTVYKYKGKTSVTEFDGDTFTLRLTDLAANTTYYYFTEVICGGAATFSEISSFRTGTEDSYVDWNEGENVGGDI